jgi:hypothetical protein
VNAPAPLFIVLFGTRDILFAVAIVVAGIVTLRAARS